MAEMSFTGQRAIYARSGARGARDFVIGSANLKTSGNAGMSDQPPPDGKGGAPPRIALPKGIAQTLKYLHDFDLESLRAAVENELRRRRAEKGTETQLPAAEAAPAQVSRASLASATPAVEQDRSELPLGKASLIRASAQSGMKPQAIARSLRMPLAEVNRVLKSEAKPKR
jgi:hypothetical protein